MRKCVHVVNRHYKQRFGMGPNATVKSPDFKKTIPRPSPSRMTYDDYLHSVYSSFGPWGPKMKLKFRPCPFFNNIESTGFRIPPGLETISFRRPPGSREKLRRTIVLSETTCSIVSFIYSKLSFNSDMAVLATDPATIRGKLTVATAEMVCGASGSAAL